MAPQHAPPSPWSTSATMAPQHAPPPPAQAMARQPSEMQCPTQVAAASAAMAFTQVAKTATATAFGELQPQQAALPPGASWKKVDPELDALQGQVPVQSDPRAAEVVQELVAEKNKMQAQLQALQGQVEQQRQDVEFLRNKVLQQEEFAMELQEKVKAALELASNGSVLALAGDFSEPTGPEQR